MPTPFAFAARPPRRVQRATWREGGTEKHRRQTNRNIGCLGSRVNREDLGGEWPGEPALATTHRGGGRAGSGTAGGHRIGGVGLRFGYPREWRDAVGAAAVRGGRGPG